MAARRRDLLKQYYQQTDEPVSPISPVQKRIDPLDIDSEDYHAQVAFNLSVKELGFIDLLVNQNNLSTDIKELDGNVKSLIYQNYAKFLSAQSVIVKIKDTAADMDKQVSALDGKMNEIANSILKISSGLDEKRKNVRQLSKVSDLLKKLDFIIGMPATLSQLLEAKKYSEAVLFYAKANTVLSKYKSTMFSQIQTECQDVLKHVGVKVQNRVFSGTGNVLQISEGIGMLVALETLPPSDLAKQFVYKVSDMIDKVLGSQKFANLIKQESMLRQDSISRGSTHLRFDSKSDNPLPTPQTRQSQMIKVLSNNQMGLFGSPTPSSAQILSSLKEDPKSAHQATPSIITETPAAMTGQTEIQLTPAMLEFTRFNRTFLNDLGLFADCYDAFFLKPRTEPSTIKELDDLKMGVFAKSLSPEHRQVADTNLKAILKEKLDKYFSYLDAQLQLPQQISNSAFAQFVQVLSILRMEIGNANVLKNLAGIDSRMSTLTVTVLDRIINGVFGKVNYDFFAKIRALTAAPDSQVFHTVRQMTNWIKETLIAKALPALEDFVNPETSNSFGPSEILLRIKAALVGFWTELAQEMIGNKRGDNNPYFLILARLSHEWSKNGIESIFSMYNERLFMPAMNGTSVPGLSEAEIGKSAAEISSLYHKLSQKLLGRFAQVQTAAFTIKIREYVKNPLMVDQITVVSSVWRTIQTNMDDIQQQLKNSFKEEVKLNSKATIQSKATSKQPQADLGRSKTTVQPRKRSLGNPKPQIFDNILDTLDTLFDERLTYLPQMIELKVNLALAVIMKCIIKCFIEQVRQQSFTEKECHQFQVDMRFVKENFLDYLEQKILDNMADQGLKSAVQNCKTKFTPLDSASVDRIVGRL